IGLSAGLNWLADWMQKAHGMTIHLSAAPAADPQRADVRDLLFEIIRELLFNVIKHSGTREAYVIVELSEEGLIHATVEDRGSGFDAAKLREKRSGEGRFGLV